MLLLLFHFARNPGWHASYDQDPTMAEATRRKVYDMLVAEKMISGDRPEGRRQGAALQPARQ
jgi:hypothetical protein